MSSWVPHMVQVMWEVFQDLRCDKTHEVRQQEVQSVKVALPSLDNEQCRYVCKFNCCSIHSHHQQTETKKTYITVQMVSNFG